MRIGVISDTHGHVANTRRAVDVMDELKLDCVLHCGDIGSVEVVRLFTSWPTHFVLGNVDHNEEELRSAIAAAGQTCHGRFGALELAGKRIALLHDDDGARFRETVGSGTWDVVCYGHTHAAKIEKINGALVLTPGAMYRASRHSFAYVDLPSLEAEHVSV